MFGLDLSEMLVIAILVIVVVGPDDLPKLLALVGRYYGKLRRMSDDLRRAFNAEIARAEADERRSELRRRKEELEKLGLMPPADAAPRKPRRPSTSPEDEPSAPPAEPPSEPPRDEP